MTPLTCAQARELLPWFVGGDLVDERLGAVRKHLVDCVPCRREAAGLQQATKALQSVAIHPAVGNSTAAGSVRGDDAGIDDAAFVAMHRDIMAAVERHEARFERASGRWLALRSWFTVAALVLVAIGCWIGSGASLSSPLLSRPPLATPASVNHQAVNHQAIDRQLRAVPYAGQRSESFDHWLLLGDETGPVAAGIEGTEGIGEPGAGNSAGNDPWGVWATDGVGQGMSGRDRLRPLVEDQFTLPLRVPRRR